jgi:hypothetical protein
MKRLAPILLAAVMICASPLAAGAAGGAYLGTPSSHYEILVEEAIVFVALGAQLLTLDFINTARGSVAEEMRTFHNKNIDEMQWDTTMYAHDHRPLESSMNAAALTALSLVQTIAAMSFYGGTIFANGGAAADARAEYFMRGVSSPSPADYPGDYIKRSSSLISYAAEALGAAEKSRTSAAGFQTLIRNMNEATNTGTDEGELGGAWEDEFDALKDFHENLPYWAADPDDEIFDAVWGAATRAGYRRALQASSLAANFRNAQINGVRAAVMAQIEADAKFANNAEREETERHEAFGRGVGTWQNIGGGTGY